MGRIFAGHLIMQSRVVDGWLEVVNGYVGDFGHGPPPREPDKTGWIVPSLVNAHTHVADSFLRNQPKPRDVAKLVGPGGWKAQKLQDADPDAMKRGVLGLDGEMHSVGVGRFVDFREGGLAGARWLNGLAPQLSTQAFVMGRPSKPTFDEHEAAALLAECDGIGLSGLRDLGQATLDDWADACKAARKPLAIHVSEDERDDMDKAIALEPRFVVHMCHATKSDMRKASDERIGVVVCPRSNHYFGLPTPIQALVESGCNVAIGTDNGMLADGDLTQELAHIKRIWRDAETAQLLRMASYNGHELLHVSHKMPPRIGEAADFTVVPRHGLAF